MKRILYVGTVVILVLAGCRDKKPAVVQAPSVNVIQVLQVLQQDYPWRMEYPAQVSGSLDVQIRAQVGGILQARLYDEGEFVSAGTQLFQIDDKEYKVELEKACGTLSQAQADVKRTQRSY
ncbi:MAG: biotin/lipoyl-binding protein [Elusimicrobiaceae bacterium]|nr:biotin/lipoyl-binding protein [Elusimicrobiaceae bacterium]